MSRRLLTNIDVWSVARTVFPLAWLVSSAILFLVYLLAGSLLMELASELYDMPGSVRGVGIAVSLLASVITGFIYTIFVTLFSVLAAWSYNVLADLGGGVIFQYVPADAEAPSDGESPEQVATTQTVPVVGTVRHTKIAPEEEE